MTGLSLDERAARAFAHGCGETLVPARIPGCSNAVFRARRGDRGFVLKLAAPSRSAALGLEHRVLELLAARGIPVADVICADLEGAVVGLPFLLMRDAGPETLAERAMSEGRAARPLFREMGALLAAVHRVAVEQDPAIPVRDLESYRAELDGLLRWARASGCWNDAELRAIAGVVSELPPLVPGSLCHHDFHAVQCVVRGGRISALLDWEESGLGCAAADVAIAQVNLSLYSDAALVADFLEGYAVRGALSPGHVEGYRSVRVAQAIALIRAWSRPGGERAAERARRLIAAELREAR